MDRNTSAGFQSLRKVADFKEVCIIIDSGRYKEAAHFFKIQYILVNVLYKSLCIHLLGFLQSKIFNESCRYSLCDLK